MRISDWSSDVCSSDLCLLFRKPELGLQAVDLRQFIVRDDLVGQRLLDRPPELPAFCECKHAPSLLLLRFRQTPNNETAAGLALSRSDERRAVKERARTCQSRVSQYH